MKATIGIKDNNSQAVVDSLSKILADEYVLCVKTRNAHWNVEGIDFYDKHKFFESQFEQVDEFIDQVAERIRMLGHYAPATLQSFLDLTSLTEASRQKNDSKGFIRELLAYHESIIIRLRENVSLVADKLRDSGTIDFITGLMKEHEKMAWFLRSHIQ